MLKRTLDLEIAKGLGLLVGLARGSGSGLARIRGRSYYNTRLESDMYGYVWIL